MSHPPQPPDDQGATPPVPPPPPYGAAPPPPPPPPPPYGAAPPPPPGYGAAPGYGGPVGPANNQKALWAMISGILGVLCCGILSIVAIVLGTQAKNEIRSSGGAQSGEGQAQAGFILGIVGCVLWAAGIVFYGIAAVVASGS